MHAAFRCNIDVSINNNMEVSECILHSDVVNSNSPIFPITNCPETSHQLML